MSNITEHAPGQIGGYVYPRGGPAPRPHNVPVPEHMSPAPAILRVLNTWPWARGELDAFLLLGWIAAAMIGGALDWRPTVWITGGRGTGKSTLLKLIAGLFGQGGLIWISDTTAAGIWQKLGHSTLPVAIDELESEADGRRVQAVLKFIRQAGSGGLILRGGATHEGVEFRARSCFLCASILVPPLSAQDRSRITVLRLNDLPADATPPMIDLETLALWGRQLRRRMIDTW